MTTFDDREQAFEAKFAHDEEIRFRAQARCKKLLGLWAAKLLGYRGTAADAYAAGIVSTDLREAGHEDVLRKIAADLIDHATIEEIQAQMTQFLSQAREQILEQA